ncbi:SDR family oxidoreductase [Streptomyces sp. TLI_105]|uniref:SDR family oxidoreductase n=1 Tax=Streptomyces sp. TLI_105 TaxID=1881019 RepID=UPI000896087E|nr:SDR family oxidoreductase [Streptomyces sp. TLI_105]SEB63141.1 Short-chain dehydrogenase [Streptomyces sp. TLI_105]
MSKRVVITGGALGLGRALAERHAYVGGRVLTADRRPQTASRRSQPVGRTALGRSLVHPLRRAGATTGNAFFTGASSGPGEQMARTFAARGRDLALCARRTDRLQALREELLAAHPGIKVSVRSLDANDHQQVFDVFHALREDLDGLDRIIVNVGLGKGKPIGTGRFDANLQTARANFTAALAQCEAAMEIFRAQGSGHLVVVSSMSTMRGFPRNLTTYAASKAGLSALAEGNRAEMTVTRTPIAVTNLHPGYIATDQSAARAEDAFDVEGVHAWLTRQIDGLTAPALKSSSSRAAHRTSPTS